MNIKYKMGWRPDKPDFRDYIMERPEIISILAKIRNTDPDVSSTIPTKVDLTKWCSPIEDQGNLGSCTAQACTSLLEYFERKAFGNYINGSRLFLYKVTRNLINETGDTGAEIRNTIGAITMFGIPPEKYYPYDITKYDEEPPAMCYALAANYKAIKYVRLDSTNIPKTTLLNNIKTNIASGLPSIFGFTVYSSIQQADNTGKIPFPDSKENIEGGHAIDAVGYDDDLVITNENNGQSTKGAFIIRNSWGTSWGNKGYGYLPYDYVLQEIAMDWWTLISANWIHTGNFGF